MTAITRHRFRKITAIVAALVVVLGFVAACGGSSGSKDSKGSGSSTPTTRPTIRYGALTDTLTSMDPIQSFGKLAHEMAFIMFSSLVRYPPGNAGQPIEPDLATKLPTSAIVNGKQVWTVDMRHGVMCPKGEDTPAYELTSADVVYSIQRAEDPKQSLWSGQYYNYDSVTAVDPYTVTITLKQPQSAAVFLPSISDYLGGFVVCSKAAQAEGNTEFGKSPVGTGPFMYSSFTPGQSVTLVANDTYFRGKPTAAGWNIRFFSSNTSIQAAMLSGDLDASQSPTGALDAWAKTIKSNKGLKVVSSPVFGQTYLFFNTQDKYLSNVLVRQAISYAANRSDFVASLGTSATATSSAWSDAFAHGISDAHAKSAGLTYDFDLAKANALMAQAGYPQGFSLKVDVSTAAPETLNILQAQLKKININVELNPVDATTYKADISKGTEPIIVNALGFYGSPQDAYSNYFASTGALNLTHYAGADSLIAQAASETDATKQQALWTEINDKILTDAAVKPLYTSSNVYAGVCGFTWGGANPPVKIPSSWDGTYNATVDTSVKSC